MKKLHVVAFILIFLTQSCSAMRDNPPETVPAVDLTKYSGLWYEIAAYPTRFEEGCHCITAEYTLAPNGRYIEVQNRCRKDSATGPESGIRGKAFVVKNSGNAKLKVQFFWPFRAPYWVVGLADDYSWALVSGPSRKYLWILSRTPQMDEETYNGIILYLQSKGFDTDKLRPCNQQC
jgi:apolipoprotein D and lipocalin family protein